MLDKISTHLLVMFLHVLGLMRLNECEQVKETLDKHLGINLTVVDGSELFLGRLAGITEPEAKRKIIGETCEANPGEPASLILTLDNSH
jgi:GMP synthase PP-ATPase subunit